MVTETRDVPQFTGIKVSSGIEVFVTQGEPQRVEVQADENLQEWIRTEVNGTELNIFTDKIIRLAKTKKVTITCKSIENINISSAGEVTGLNKFKADNLEIGMSSAGQLKFEVDANEIRANLSSAAKAELKGTAKKLNADMSSAGELNAFELQANTGDISVSSAANAKVTITDEAGFHASSAGHIGYQGEPRIREINTSSGGSVNKR